MHDDILVSLRVTGRSPMRSQYWFSSRIEEIDNDCVIIMATINRTLCIEQKLICEVVLHIVVRAMDANNGTVSVHTCMQ